MNKEAEWAMIINLKSGKRHFRIQINYLLKSLDKAGIAYEQRITGFAGHAVLIARNFARRGFKKFLIVGGDGTVSEVINGIFGSGVKFETPPLIALIPRGTGNDWARFWGLTCDYKKSLKTFLEAKTRFIDLGMVSYVLEGENVNRYYINSVGFGLDAVVAHHTNRLKRYVGSHSFLYLIALLAAVFQYKSKPAQIAAEEQTIDDLLFTMNIANGCYSGGGMKQNPDALPWDGLMDVMMARKPSVKNILTALPLVFNGKILKHPIIESFRTKEITLHSQNGNYFEADGIVIHYTPPAKITVVPAAMKMIVP